MNHEKMVSKINGSSHSSSLPIRRGNDWSCSGFSATTATNSRSRGQNLHRGCLWVTAGVRRVGRWNGNDYKVRKFLFDRH